MHANTRSQLSLESQHGRSAPLLPGTASDSSLPPESPARWAQRAIRSSEEGMSGGKSGVSSVEGRGERAQQAWRLGVEGQGVGYFSCCSSENSLKGLFNEGGQA